MYLLNQIIEKNDNVEPSMLTKASKSHFFFFLTMDPPVWDGFLKILWRRSKNASLGVPIVAQWLTNPTRKHEVAGLVPGLAQWVKDPVLPRAVV